MHCPDESWRGRASPRSRWSSGCTRHFRTRMKFWSSDLELPACTLYHWAHPLPPMRSRCTPRATGPGPACRSDGSAGLELLDSSIRCPIFWQVTPILFLSFHSFVCLWQLRWLMTECFATAVLMSLALLIRSLSKRCCSTLEQGERCANGRLHH